MAENQLGVESGSSSDRGDEKKPSGRSTPEVQKESITQQTKDFLVQKRDKIRIATVMLMANGVLGTMRVSDAISHGDTTQAIIFGIATAIGIAVPAAYLWFETGKKPEETDKNIDSDKQKDNK